MVRKISSLLVSKIQNSQNFKINNDEVKVNNNNIDYYLYGNNVIRYVKYAYLPRPQVDINFYGFLTRTTISRVSEILYELSNGRYKVKMIKGNPYLIEYDNISTKKELPFDNYYNIEL